MTSSTKEYVPSDFSLEGTLINIVGLQPENQKNIKATRLKSFLAPTVYHSVMKYSLEVEPL